MRISLALRVLEPASWSILTLGCRKIPSGGEARPKLLAANRAFHFQAPSHCLQTDDFLQSARRRPFRSCLPLYNSSTSSVMTPRKKKKKKLKGGIGNVDSYSSERIKCRLLFGSLASGKQLKVADYRKSDLLTHEELVRLKSLILCVPLIVYREKKNR